ncbi:MAG: hypothetical protein PVG03_15930 [Desulfarculaceae bacterium]|jgi:hypothetical protein
MEAVIRNLQTWAASYLAQSLKPAPKPPPGEPMTICLAVADHFEPFQGGTNLAEALERLLPWEKGLAGLCQGLADSRGRPPQHTFFYPLEEYHPEVLDRLAALCQQGWGDVEVHLHHQGETSSELEDKLLSFAELLHSRHGLLRKDPQTGRVAYGFIHGNWALDNSLPGGKWCGVNDELRVLSRSGCYADFTLPAAPSPAQTRTINSIYYAEDDPLRPKSHDRGRRAAVGAPPSGDLLIVQGVLALNWRWRKAGFLPRLENSDIGAHRPPRLDRVPLWLRFAPWVDGAEQVRFIKLHCHGAPARHHDALLGEQARGLLEHLTAEFGRNRGFRLHFVTCWEMVQMIHALERGEEF